MRFLILSVFILLTATSGRAATTIRNSDEQLLEKLDEIFTDTKAQMEAEERLNEKFGKLEPAAGSAEDAELPKKSKNREKTTR